VSGDEIRDEFIIFQTPPGLFLFDIIRRYTRTHTVEGPPEKLSRASMTTLRTLVVVPSSTPRVLGTFQIQRPAQHAEGAATWVEGVRSGPSNAV
jgi:hypothetical protein